MWNRRPVPYHQRPHWFPIVRRTTSDQSCPVRQKIRYPVDSFTVEQRNVKLDSWKRKKKSLGILEMPCFWKCRNRAHLNKQLLGIQGDVSSRKREISWANVVASYRKLLWCSTNKGQRSFSSPTEAPSSLPRNLWGWSYTSLNLICLLKYLHIPESRHDHEMAHLPHMHGVFQWILKLHPNQFLQIRLHFRIDHTTLLQVLA